MSDLLSEFTYDERQVYLYIRNWAGQFISSREVARRADGKARFEQDRNWVHTPLSNLRDNGYIIANEHGQYKIKKDIDPITGALVHPEADAKDKPKKFIAPVLQTMLDEHELRRKAVEPAEPVIAPTPKKIKLPKFIAPEIAAILRKSGKLQD